MLRNYLVYSVVAPAVSFGKWGRGAVARPPGVDVSGPAGSIVQAPPRGNGERWRRPALCLRWMCSSQPAPASGVGLLGEHFLAATLRKSTMIRGWLIVIYEIGCLRALPVRPWNELADEHVHSHPESICLPAAGQEEVWKWNQVALSGRPGGLASWGWSNT